MCDSTEDIPPWCLKTRRMYPPSYGFFLSLQFTFFSMSACYEDSSKYAPKM